MPYIDKDMRIRLDPAIDVLSTALLNTAPVLPGTLNYILTKLCLKYLPMGTGYLGYNEVIGVLECVKQELYRRAIAPYEDDKIKENGDVY